MPIVKTSELIAPFPVAILMMKNVTSRNIAIDEMILINL
jgi:hypothetical protein